MATLISVHRVFIADSRQVDESAHEGLFNYTLFLHVPVNNLPDAIIHVAMLINTFKRNGVTLGSCYWGQALVLWHRYSGHFTVWSLPAIYYQFGGLNGAIYTLYVATTISAGPKRWRLWKQGGDLQISHEYKVHFVLKMAENISVMARPYFQISWRLMLTDDLYM